MGLVPDFGPSFMYLDQFMSHLQVFYLVLILVVLYFRYFRTLFCPPLRSPRLWVTETLLFSPCMDDVCIILMHASTFMFYFSSPSARGLYFFLSPAPRVLYIFLSPDSRGLYFFCPQSFRAITFFSFLAVIFWSLFICGYSSGHYTFLSGHWVIIAHQYLFFWSSLPRHAPLNVISGCSERPFS